MKLAWRFYVVNGQLTVRTGFGIPPQGPVKSGEGVLSIGPDGREDDQPLGMHGAYEVCALSGGFVTFSPSNTAKFTYAPSL